MLSKPLVNHFGFGNYNFFLLLFSGFGFIFDFQHKSHTLYSLFHIYNVSPRCILHLLFLLFLVYVLALKYWEIEGAMLFVIVIYILLLLSSSM